ncbi:MAG TPA: DegT/DnrJ/EryC1/StrS family aminotransferase [Kiritimatiellia bacterium]|nr:DegT/DnrJ/EryC1/StrS family aminotransferase [Kiritimatiellia bacterium]HMO99107.1 DegT/DnrJ/EryC1/StrS family aminotransferase [Kiritimatiellia bacterium]HMP96941.1 DegT/DnrJ/EryC1/StrS family aminotransferase [Kiritimatiellia bacterium]
MSIPLLDLKPQYQALKDELKAVVERVMESQYFILGPEVEGLEREVADYSHCQFGIGASSGTDALLMALMAAGIQAGDEVITSPFTFFATAGCIARLGARPVFVDIDPVTFNLDPARIEAAVTPRTKAIMPVHLYGQMAEMEPIMSVAERHGLIVIEDAAQAIGAEYRGRRAGSIGHMGCFSFFPSKNLGGFGDGGMVTTNDPVLAEKLKLLRNHGMNPKYYYQVIGGNFRLDALQAAVLRVKLKHLDAWSEQRQQNAAWYGDAFAATGITVEATAVDCLSREACRPAGGGGCRLQAAGRRVILPTALPDRRHIYNQYVIRTAQRDAVIAHLVREKIGHEIYYPVPLHQQECFQYLGYREGDFPVSECAAKTTLALPIYPEAGEANIRAVAAAVAAAVRG